MLIGGIAVLFGSLAGCEGTEAVIPLDNTSDTLSITVADQDFVVIEQLELEVGDTAVLTAVGENAISQQFLVHAAWSSFNPQVASVSDAGVLRALGAGETDIIATHQSAMASVATTVVDTTLNPSPRPPPLPPGTILFECDWPNVGLDAADCGNTIFSAEVETSDAGVSVVDATDFGLSSNWPNDRAMLVRCQDRIGGCARQVVRNLGQWPTPKAGDVLAFRISRTTASEVLGPNSGNWNAHGFKTSPAGGSNATTFILYTQANTDGTWRVQTNTYSGFSWPDTRWCVVEVGGRGGCNGPDLVWFDGYAEYEFHIKYTFPTDNSYTVDAKIYDIVGDSLMNWTWQNINGSKTLPSPEYAADLDGGAKWNWDQVSLGHSATGEPNWGDLAGAPLHLSGGYAVCAGDWCPRYGELPGSN